MKWATKNTFLLPIILIVYIASIYFNVGFFQADEHFQIIEFANAKLGYSATEQLPSEYHERIRSTLQPTIACTIFASFAFFNIQDPYLLALILRTLTALLALVSIRYFTRYILQAQTIKKPTIYIYLAYLLAFIPFINSRFSSETWSGLVFLIALTYGLNENRKNYATLGILLGISFLFRFQLGIAIAGALVWMVQTKKLDTKKLSKVILGMLSAVVCGTILDSWFYGETTFTAWNYFEATLITTDSPSFGNQPWHFYFSTTLTTFGTLLGTTLLISFFTFLLFYPKHILTWIWLPFLLVHIFIPHKELRFLIPLANTLPLIIILSIQKTESLLKPLYLKGFAFVKTAILVVFIAVNSVFLMGLMTKPADIGRAKITQFIGENYQKNNINLICLPWANPYAPWGAETFHYRNNRVNTQEIAQLSQLTDSIYDPTRTNLVVMRKLDLDNNRQYVTSSGRYKLVRVKEAYPKTVNAIGKHLGLFDPKEGLILFYWRIND